MSGGDLILLLIAIFAMYYLLSNISCSNINEGFQQCGDIYNGECDCGDGKAGSNCAVCLNGKCSQQLKNGAECWNNNDCISTYCVTNTWNNIGSCQNPPSGDVSNS
jgi:hypothetical protein